MNIFKFKPNCVKYYLIYYKYLSKIKNLSI